MTISVTVNGNARIRFAATFPHIGVHLHSAAWDGEEEEVTISA